MVSQWQQLWAIKTANNVAAWWKMQRKNFISSWMKWATLITPKLSPYGRRQSSISWINQNPRRKQSAKSKHKKFCLPRTNLWWRDKKVRAITKLIDFRIAYLKGFSIRYFFWTLRLGIQADKGLQCPVEMLFFDWILLHSEYNLILFTSPVIEVQNYSL